MKIDLTSSITPNFKMYEALYLVQWDVYCFPNTEDILDEIKLTCEVLERLRSFHGCPLHITSFYRPPHYNQSIRGSKSSYHMQGKATDYIPVGKDVNVEKKRLKNSGLLQDLNIRLENNGDGLWLHIDRGQVKTNRFFLP